MAGESSSPEHRRAQCHSPGPEVRDRIGSPMNWRRAAVATAIAAAITVVAYARCHHGTHAPGATTPTTRGRARLAELRHQPPGSISGTVTSAGAPVPGATVCARPSRDAAHPVCITTDARGAYTFDELPPAAYLVWASALRLAGGPWRGPAPAFDDRLWLAAGEHRTGIDLVLLAGAAPVRGTVRDVRGHAIAGALIHVGGDSRSPPVYTTRSEPDGTFAAWALPGDIYVATSADHYVDGEARDTAPSDALEIVLTPEAVLGGVVVEAGTRRPLEDATVDVSGTTTRTGAGGRFQLAKLPPGRYKPTATSVGGYGEAAESVLLGLGRTIDDLVIEIYPVAVVVGRVVIDDGASTRPCPPEQGEVSLGRYGSTAFYRARTTTDGDVLLEGVVPGAYQVTAACDRFLGQVPYPDLIVGDSDVDDLVWKVHPGVRVAGHVATRTGAPIADAVINLMSRNGVTFASATSGRDGAFVADGLAPGATEVYAYATGYPRAPTPASVIATLGATATVDLVLTTGGSITGEVVDEAGAPAAGAVVEARGPDSGSERTDARGRFTITALSAGSYEVSVRSPWGEPPPRPDARGASVTVTADSTSHVHLVAEAAAGTITGTVTDAAGTPITDAYVTAAREDDAGADPDRPAYVARGAWHDPPVLTALDGSFRLTGLPRGRFAVRAYREGGPDAIALHVDLGGHAHLTIRPSGVLAGVVVPSGAATSIDDITIAATDKAREVSREERLYHTGGRFALRDLPAGTYRLTVDGDPRSTITATLAEGQRREDLRLVAQPRFTIRGRLVSAAGKPLVGWRVEAPRLERSETSDGRTIVVSSSEVAITTAGGRFLLHNLPSGPTTISAGDVSRDPDAPLAQLRELTLQGATDVDLGDVPVTAPAPRSP
jgi:hypothetical protein